MKPKHWDALTNYTLYNAATTSIFKARRRLTRDEFHAIQGARRELAARLLWLNIARAVSS